MIVCALDDERILGVNDAAVEHYGYSRAEFEKLTHPQRPGLRSRAAVGRRPLQRRADRAHLEACQGRRRADRSRDLFAPAGLRRPARGAAGADGHHRAQARRGAARLHGAARRPDRAAEPHAAAPAAWTRCWLHTRRSGDKVAVLVLDLDNFKAVNDTLGHAVGDKLLQRRRQAPALDRCARRTRSRASAPTNSRSSRAGIDAARGCRAAGAGACWQAIGEPYLLDGHSVVIGASIGIAMAPGDGDDAEKLLKNADMALSRAKSDGARHVPLLRSRRWTRAPRARRKIEIDLRAAIQNDVLRPHYQPLVDLATGRITGFEALVRWPHPERGMISPAEFIPVAEETGLINALGGLMLRRACMDAAQLAGRRPRRGQPVAAAVPRRQPVVGGDGCAEAIRPAAEAAGAGNHRDAAAGKERARCWRRCMRCARSACASRWTISAPAIRR